MTNSQYKSIIDRKIKKQHHVKKSILKSLRIQEQKFGLLHAKEEFIKSLSYSNTNVPVDDSLPNCNLLIFGNTGTGKTYTTVELCKLLNIPYDIVNCTMLTTEGYHGVSIKEAIKNYIDKNKDEFDPIAIQTGVIILDEIDKINVSGKVSGGRELQKELLKIMDGQDLFEPNSYESSVKGKEAHDYNTKDMLFIGIGSLIGDVEVSKIGGIGFGNEAVLEIKKQRAIDTESLIKHGFIPELLGRFGEVVETEDLGVEDLMDIIKSEKGVLSKYINTFAMEGVTVEFEEDFLREIAEDSLTKNIGARGLDKIFAEKLGELMYYIDEISSEYKINNETIKEANILMEINKFKISGYLTN